MASIAASGRVDLRTSDVGRPFQDLSVSYRPTDLRTGIEQAYETGEPVMIKRATWERPGEDARILDVEVRVVPGTANRELGVVIAFHDVTALARLADEHEERRRELETTNEELQSTNEELETTNEELQSTNDELETMNDEQHERASELDRVNSFLEGILTSLGVGVVVLDRDHAVQVWSGESTELWGLRAGEVEGHTFDSLDIGLPVRELRGMLDAARSDSIASSLELDAVNRRGRKFRCAVRALPLLTFSREVTGVLLLMADSDHRDGQALPAF